ncbi:acetate non-utilizing protein 9 [Tulasnella sp. 418]|nr:acetate non-utilizing protein 9 [Tulasnella sp. 418]
MHTSLRRCAQMLNSGAVSSQVKEAGATLLPPIPLYRQLLRTHRTLPPEMRSLGDDYVKSEFRRHQKITNPVHVMGFLSQWKMYLDELRAQSGTTFKGRPLDPTVFEKISDEQIGQLYELMHAAKGIWKQPVELEHSTQEPQTSRNDDGGGHSKP